jgi:hypothetical protein
MLQCFTIKCTGKGVNSQISGVLWYLANLPIAVFLDTYTTIVQVFIEIDET